MKTRKDTLDDNSDGVRYRRCTWHYATRYISGFDLEVSVEQFPEQTHQANTLILRILEIWPRSVSASCDTSSRRDPGLHCDPSGFQNMKFGQRGKLEEAPVPEFFGPYFLPCRRLDPYLPSPNPCQVAPSPAPKTLLSAWDELATSILTILVTAGGRSSSQALLGCPFLPLTSPQITS